jgi:hypothetical protein
MATTIPIVIEAAPKRTFVSAIDWPGWSRGGRDETAAIDALLAYGLRYAAAIDGAAALRPPTIATAFEVVERLGGGSGTEFGIPSASAAADLRPVDESELARQIAILRACRDAFDAAAARAIGVSLTTGPRGGGRSLDKIVHHVVEADQAYLQQLGSRPPWWGDQEPADYGAARIRDLQLRALEARVRGTPPPDVNAVKKLWSPRYFVRRATWHLLDHAWEIEDRSGT